MLTQRSWRILTLFVPLLAFGQSQNSSISGTVTDPSGAVIPGAELVLTSVDRQISSKTTTGPDGLYSFPNLLPGAYDLKASAVGFKPLVQRGVAVTINQLARVDVKLEVGTDVQTVEVQSEATQLNFENASRDEGVTNETIGELPLVVAGGPRNSAQFAVLLPGVSTGGGNSSFHAPLKGGGGPRGEDTMGGGRMQGRRIGQNSVVGVSGFPL